MRMQERRLDQTRVYAWRILSQRASLLRVSILSSCFLIISSRSQPEIHIVMKPEKPRIGDNVSLTPKVPSDARLCCYWYHGSADQGNLIIANLFPPERRNGPAYTGRETVDSNCSLHITSLTHGDSGIYTVEISGDGLNTIGKTNFVVPDSIQTEAGIIPRIVIGSLVALTLFGALLCFLLRAYPLRNNTPRPNKATSSYYRNAPSGQALQHGDQTECEQLKK